MQRLFVYCFMASLMFLCASLAKEETQIGKRNSDNIRIAIIDSEHGGYGYNILVDEKVSIHQPHIPAVSGVMGFISRDDANTVAEVVVDKILHNEMPPTVTTMELDSLGVESHPVPVDRYP